MKLRIRRTALAALAGLGALVPMALAQGSSAADRIKMSSRNDGWTAIQLAPGCHLVAFIDGLVLAWGGFKDMERLRFTTAGHCNDRGLAEGPVQLSYEWQIDDGPVRIVLDGTARNGLLQGMAKQATYDQWETPGVFALADRGDGRNPMPLFFRDGCDHFVDSDGEVDFSQTLPAGDYGDCKTEGGQLLLAALAEADAPVPAPAPSALAPAPAPAPAPAAQAAAADAWSTCISGPTPRPRDGGIRALWDLTNTCASSVIVTYCFRARFEAAGDPNLCRRREMRTHEIRAGGTLTFDFNLMPPGTALSDGRTVTSNALIVSGFACTGGNFPDAYFDSDGTFRTSGC